MVLVSRLDIALHICSTDVGIVFLFLLLIIDFFFFFFFQAEDGIRDWSVTGVQTCALPICLAHYLPGIFLDKSQADHCSYEHRPIHGLGIAIHMAELSGEFPGQIWHPWRRSEERRVGKECR